MKPSDFVLITTAKKPDRECRLIAKLISFAVPLSFLERRGKKSLSSIILKARRHHFSRICIVYKNPLMLQFLSIRQLSKEREGAAPFAWLSPKIIIEKIIFASKKKFPKPCCMKIKGAKERTIKKLFSPQKYEEGTTSYISASAKKIKFYIEKEKLLELEVSYE